MRAPLIGASESYAGRARLKSWVFAILRNKIIDVLRECVRQPARLLEEAGTSDTAVEDSFNRRGFWRREERPSDWGQPDRDMTHLPENVARVFTMREMLSMETG